VHLEEKRKDEASSVTYEENSSVTFQQKSTSKLSFLCLFSYAAFLELLGLRVKLSKAVPLQA
jgi:hypothetical protein